MVRIEYEWKPPSCEQCKIFGHVYDQCPKNATATPTIDATNDGFQKVVNRRKNGKICYNNTNCSGVNVGKVAWKPIKLKKQASKAADMPSSSKTSYTMKNGDERYTFATLIIKELPQITKFMNKTKVLHEEDCYLSYEYVGQKLQKTNQDGFTAKNDDMKRSIRQR
uniref:Zinc knuckle CX2CX4HX4C n=1 Tax=Tanacetum cinerariifolium TaxID=118510 RepID=A0A6L2JZW2_TANCI|nr:hypothetical protein [Tanacetum cinerariifolium]